MQIAWCKAFSGRGHILSKSRHHVGFVAEVIADIMETAIFAYLGLFLFNDSNSKWDFKLNGVAIFGCITSRLGMVIMISMMINLSVYFDLENKMCRFFRRLWTDLNGNNEGNSIHRGQRNLSAPLLGEQVQNDNPPTEDDDDDDDDSNASASKRFLDMETQLILLLAGVRGAVSFALVANIPVYNAVTKHGSQYKAELKAMTSSSIFFTLFVFGALTYFVVTREKSNANHERVVGRFTHRVSSMPLTSDNEEDDSDGLERSHSAMALEIEHPHSPQRRPA
jgi:NhaP-type Na+/H+ or K+/H+ antiporter